MRTLLLVLPLVALCAAFHPSALKSVMALTPAQRANNAWAVLVAGSDGWSNYRHQSDICQMYQTLHNLGLPDSRIIVMMVDDIANSVYNPNKGEIYNTYEHVDVYHDVPKDYTGKLVTASNFIKILTGTAPSGGSGKKLRSTKSDHVFVFFDDHGGVGLLAFPTDYLYEEDLEKALNTMYTKNMYGSLVFHVEACEAGSMFYQANLPPNAYFHTASPPSTSSWGYMCDDPEINSCLSDVWAWFTVHYMEDNPENTMQDLFDSVYESMSNWSIPCQYGDMAITGSVISEWFNGKKLRSALPAEAAKGAAVKSYNASFISALRTHARHNSAKTAALLERETTAHAAIDAMAERLAAAAHIDLDNLGDAICNEGERVGKCAKRLSYALHGSCGRVSDYIGRIDELLFPICRADASEANAAAFEQLISSGCTEMLASL